MDAVARVAIPLLEYAPITQNSLRAGVPNLRVGSEEGSRAYSLEIADDRDNLDTVVEAAYRQIFFHAFKTDRDVNLESQLKDGQITVRDFIRGLALSDTFKRTFYGFNSNYKVVRHLCERILGRKVNGKGEELSWSIVIATKGLEGLVDVLLDSSEYLDAFGYDTVPYQRNRLLPGRELGDTPFNITTPATTSTTGESWASPRSSSPAAPPRKFLPAPRSARVVHLRTTWPGWQKWADPVVLPPAVAPTWTTCRRFPTAASAADPGLDHVQESGASAPLFCVSNCDPRDRRSPSGQHPLTLGRFTLRKGIFQITMIPNETWSFWTCPKPFHPWHVSPFVNCVRSPAT